MESTFGNSRMLRRSKAISTDLKELNELEWCVPDFPLRIPGCPRPLLICFRRRPIALCKADPTFLHITTLTIKVFFSVRICWVSGKFADRSPSCRQRITKYYMYFHSLKGVSISITEVTPTNFRLPKFAAKKGSDVFASCLARSWSVSSSFAFLESRICSSEGAKGRLGGGLWMIRVTGRAAAGRLRTHPATSLHSGIDV